MERVVKRFLLHSHRELDEVKESDFDELKQEIQMIRFEITNDLTLIKQNLTRYTSILHTGMSLVGEYFLQKNSTYSDESVNRFYSFRKHEIQSSYD